MKPVFAVRATVAFLRLVGDLNRLEEVFRILDALEGGEQGRAIVRAFRDDPSHADAFRKKPRVGIPDLDKLAKLPKGTLGRTFADDMRARNLDPRDIEQRKGDTDEDFVFGHLRETHDIWHTVTGFDTDVAGELGLQAFYATQFRASLSVLLLGIALLNTAFFAMDEWRVRLDAIVRGWQMGRSAKSFFGFDWTKHWETPLDELRVLLRVDGNYSFEPAARGGGASDVPRLILAAE